MFEIEEGYPPARAITRLEGYRQSRENVKKRLLKEIEIIDEQLRRIDESITFYVQKVRPLTAYPNLKKNIKEIFREAQSPLLKDDIYRALTARGFVFKGKNPKQALTPYLRDMKGVSYAQGLWWDAEVTAPPEVVAIKLAQAKEPKIRTHRAIIDEVFEDLKRPLTVAEVTDEMVKRGAIFRSKRVSLRDSVRITLGAYPQVKYKDNLWWHKCLEKPTPRLDLMLAGK